MQETANKSNQNFSKVEDMKEEEEDVNITKIEQKEEEQSFNRDLPFCKICWVNETSVENPLLSSCKCKGGVQYIHYQCLKQWLNTKRQVKSGPNYVMVSYLSFHCEICKESYPYLFKTHEKTYELLDFDVSKQNLINYIIIENLTLEPKIARQLYLFYCDNHPQQIKLGRGHDAELRVNDISVSRLHATMMFKDDSF